MDDEIASTVRKIMAKFPTEEGVIVWLFVEHGGLTPQQVAETLPLGISKNTAYRLYERTDRVIRDLIAAEVLPFDLIHQ